MVPHVTPSLVQQLGCVENEPGHVGGDVLHTVLPAVRAVIDIGIQYMKVRRLGINV